jgi:hypothetical protein
MILPSYVELLAAAEGLTVLNQETSTLRPFRLNREQRRILRKALRTRRLVVGKGRQVGCSTAIAFLMTMIAIRNPGLPMCIVADEQKNASKILSTIKGWLAQMGVALTVSGVESITLENGAIIDALSAISPAEGGESRVGKSRSYGFIHATEMSFWRSASAVWVSVSSTALKTAMFVVESTGAPGDSLFREIFESTSGWVRHFIGVESHAGYRSDENSISDATWEQLRRDYGFTRRDSAAWWYHHLRDVKMGDTFRMLRDFPVTPPHMFLFQEGQYIRRWKLANPPPRTAGFWDVYEEVVDEPLIIGVDTALGLGRDASALGLIGHRTGKLFRTYRNNTITIPDYLIFLRDVVDEYRPAATVVESNGPGIPVWGVVSTWTDANPVEQYSKGKSAANQDGELHVRRATIRDAIERGVIPVGGHLLTECKGSIINRHGKFDGPDDVISALSFAWMHREANGYEAPPQNTDDPSRFFIARKLAGRATPTW